MENFYTTNFGEFINKELNCTNRLINRFNEFYDLNLRRYILNDGPGLAYPLGEIRDYHFIHDSGKKLLVELKEEITAYRKDFYAMKTSLVIAERINEDPNLVFEYVSKRTFSEDGLLFAGGPHTFASYEDFNINSELRDISSFQILKDIQKDRRHCALMSY